MGEVAGKDKQKNSVTEDSQSLVAANRQLHEQIAHLVILQDVALALSSELNLDRLLDRIVRSAADLLHAPASSLLLVDQATKELVFEVVLGDKGDFLRGRRMSLKEGIAGWVATRGRSAIVNDVAKDRRFKHSLGVIDDFRTLSILAAPLVVKGKTIGVIEVLNKSTGPFNREDLGWLEALASQAAIAIDNARLYQDISDEHNKLITVQEDMRKKLARDLHDGPAQSLSAIAMGVDYVKRLLDLDTQRAREELESLRAMAIKTSREIRTLLFELRPLMLEAQGLAPTLRSYVSRLDETDGLAARFEAPEIVGRYPQEVEETIFAIAQEAISNVRKHANARNVWLTLNRRERMLTLTIKDDGQGFNLHSVQTNYEERGSFGLLNMRERAALIGANLEIRSTPRKGTVITLKVPVRAIDRGARTASP
ncbi:MAG: GAF domain-containing sensor histidine kinase [Dehalococcoidia bacterium]|nr:GAF domain-containing sensor histidine kinase [Dehalococcoidia bacterium]